MKSIRFFAALYTGKITAKVISLIAKDRGTNLPGSLALKIDPLFIKHVGNLNPDKTVFVTGTNGKSTSVNLINHILTHSGRSTTCNLGGANLTGGVAVSLIHDTTMAGNLKKEFIVMETDERYIPAIMKQLPSKHIGITNLQKDQSQRNGEISFIVNKLLPITEYKDTTFFINRDEPNTFMFKNLCENWISYGVDRNDRSYVKEDDFFTVSMPCPCCHDSLKFNYHNIDNVGDFICESCGYGSEEKSEYRINDISFGDTSTIKIKGEDINVKHFASAFYYCYALAFAVCTKLGLTPEEIKAGLESFADIKGRVAIHETSGEAINYMKMKQENSETLQSSMDYVSEKPGSKRLFIGFDEYLDFNPAYTFVFNLYDCDFRKISKNDIKRWTCTSKALANAAAVKLCYDGLPADKFRPAVNSTNSVISGLLEEDKKDGLTDDIYMIEEVAFWKKRGVK